MSCSCAGPASANRSDAMSSANAAGDASQSDGTGQLTPDLEQVLNTLIKTLSSLVGKKEQQGTPTQAPKATPASREDSISAQGGTSRSGTSGQPTSIARSEPTPSEMAPQETSIKATRQPAGASNSSDATAMVSEINRVRAQNGLNPLTLNPSLSGQAAQNNDISQSDGIGHHVSKENWASGARGEITASASGKESAEQAVDQWLNSPGHRAIMLNPDMTKVGVDLNGKYATAVLG